jgi:hypothetical protein
VVTPAAPAEGVIHEPFPKTEECYFGAFAEALPRLAATVAEAAEREHHWLQRVRAGLVALLGFLDDEPPRGRVLFAGPAGSEAERRVQSVLGELLAQRSSERVTAAGYTPASGFTDELVLGGVFSVIRQRALEPSGGRLVELAPSLMAFIVTSYIERRVGNGERAGSSARLAVAHAGGSLEIASSEPLERAGLPIRTTYRTSRVLQAISAAPRSSNREIAQAAGLSDEGQTSKLLGRLERRGLIENVGLGAACGEPNAWLLTAYGRDVVHAIGHGFGESADVRGRRRIRGAA